MSEQNDTDKQCGICGVGLSKASIANGEEHCVSCKNKYLAACWADA